MRRSFSKIPASIGRLLTFLDRLHWLWLGLAAPFLLFPSPKRSLALFVIPGTWLLHWGMARRPPRHPQTPNPSTALRADVLTPDALTATPLPLTPLNVPLLVLALMVLVSTWATYDMAQSLPALSSITLGFGVYFAAARESRRLTGWLASLGVFAVGVGLGLGLVGLLGTNWMTTKISLLNPVTSRIPTPIRDFLNDPTGFHPNIVAGTLLWALPLLAALSLYFLRPDRAPKETLKPWHLWALRAGTWLVTLFAGGVFMLTQSRAGYLGLAITLPLLAFIALPPRGRWIVLGLAALLGVILGLTVSPEILAQARDWATGSGITSENAFSVGSLETRLEIWSRAIYGLQDFPFTGMGMNTFREVVHVLYPLFLISPDIDIGHPHNEFLHAGLDLGIPGMVAFASLYLVAFWMLFDAWIRLRNVPPLTPDPQPRHSNFLLVSIFGLGGGLLAHMLYGLLDSVVLSAKPGFVFWYLLGLIAGLYGLIRRTETGMPAGAPAIPVDMPAGAETEIEG